MAVEKHEGGGILGFFKRLFRRKEAHQRSRAPHELPLDAPQTQTERKEKKAKDFPQQVIEELKRVSPSHPARQLLQGVTFSEECIRRNEGLGRLLLDIVHQSGIDPRQYHDREWLIQKLAALNQVDQEMTALPEDQSRLQQVEANFETLIESAQTGDERIAKVKQDIQNIKQGQAPPITGSFVEAVNNLPNTQEGNAIKELARPIITGQDVTREQYEDLYAQIDDVMRRLTAGVNQTDKTSLENYGRDHEKYLTVLEKLGKVFVEKVQRGGTFRDEVRRIGSENMEKAFHESPELMDYWFFKILEPVLYNERLESHRELYSLYSMGDMETFLDMVLKKKDASGYNIGRELVGHYTLLKNTVFQSHDMDYYAAHPSQDMREFITSTSMFLNTYIDVAFQDPLVVLAKRMYETALLSIRENHNGFIPREDLAWTLEGRMGIKLDQMVEDLVKQAIRYKQLYHLKIDPVTGRFAENRWGRRMIDPERPYTMDDLYGGQPEQSTNWRRQLGDLKLASSLKQAKGLALVDMRLLEIIGRSKGTGSAVDKPIEGNYSFKTDGFNSVPYEGIVRHIEPIIHYFTRYGIGGDVYQPFFNMMVTEHHDWSPEKMRRLLELYYDGDHEKMKDEFGEEIDTRLNTMDNPFGFSGMWGTYTKWRHGDATRDFDDWELDQALSTANKLSMIGDKLIREHGAWQLGGMTDERKTVQYYLEEDDRWKGSDGRTAEKYLEYLQNKYKAALSATGDYELQKIANDPFLFKIKWKQIGINEKDPVTGKTYSSLLKAHLEEVKKLHPEVGNLDSTDPSKDRGEMKVRARKLERAYKARIWVQSVMRAPLLAARELKTKYKVAGYEREGPLRKKIIYELLGIDLDEIGKERTPTVAEAATLDRIMDLEGAVAAVSQTAKRENMDLVDADFDCIEEEGLKHLAREYWKLVKKAMLGDHTAQDWYKKLGIEDADISLPVGLRYHRINWNNIDKISLEHIGEADHSIFVHDEGYCIGTSATGASDLIDTKLMDRDWRYLFSTEDMGWEYLKVAMAGERNVVRRAGDLASHVEFNRFLEEYLTTQVKGRIDIDKALELLQKMWIAMAGDFGDAAVDSCGRIIYTTGMMYRKADWAWKYPGIGQLASLLKDTSIMQMIYGRVHADALGPNELYKLVHGAEELKLVPPHVINKLTGKRTYWSEWDVELLEKRLGCTKANMTYELITMAVLVTIALTLWRAFTAEDEESKGGGGQ